MHLNKSAYIGRFAPSPSGPLHFGSLVCALASYLDAKKYSGQWLLRIEDIDPPRAQKDAEKMIIRSLIEHRLRWDGEILYQSSRSQAFNATLEDLKRHGHAYRCNCSRKRLRSLNMIYDGHCRQHQPAKPPAALRLKISPSSNLSDDPVQIPDKHSSTQIIGFDDATQGKITEDLALGGDFIIHRKDGLFAYQLAVVVDDIYQGITHVVRGYDLIDSTAKQIYLFRLLGHKEPVYAHIPVLTGQDGHKLSKQAHAPAINDQTPRQNVYMALCALQLRPPKLMRDARVEEQLAWGIDHWPSSHLRGVQAISESSLSDSFKPSPLNRVF